MFNQQRSTFLRNALALTAVIALFFASAMPSLAQGPKGSVPKIAPPIGATEVTSTPQWDKIAGDAAKSLGLANYVYEAWQLPAVSGWDDTFNYYNTQMTQAGWNGQGMTQEFEGGKVGAWINPDTKTGLVVFYLNSPDGTTPAFDLAIFGITTPAPAAPTTAKPAPKTAELNNTVAGIASAVGFSNYTYEAWELPANSTWDDTFSYYNGQMTQAGWNGQGVTQDFAGGKIGVWVNNDTKSGLVVVFVASPDGTKSAYDLAIFGR